MFESFTYKLKRILVNIRKNLIIEAINNFDADDDRNNNENEQNILNDDSGINTYMQRKFIFVENMHCTDTEIVRYKCRKL